MNQILLSFDPHTANVLGTPVPVEVFDERLTRVANPVVYLSAQELVEVPGPGRYFVRIELPSGEQLGGTVQVETADPAPLVLEAEERSPRESLAWAYASQSVRQASNQPRHYSTEGARGTPVRDFPQSSMVKLDGLFRMSPPVSGGPIPDAWVLQRVTGLELEDDEPDVDQLDDRLLRALRLSRPIPFPPPFEPTQVFPEWFPLYLRCWSPSKNADDLPEQDRLLAIPPSRDARILLIRAEADPQTDATIRALVNTQRPGSEALLSYVAQGSAASARRIAPKITDFAIKMLEDKREDPVSAAIAGYFMLKAGRVERPRWLKNLADWFPTLPDGAVIYGASLLCGKDEDACEQNSKARHYLIEAVNRGIPTYTIGLRLLFDGLRRLVKEGVQDEELNRALAKVRVVAAYADWETITTSFEIPAPSKRLLFGSPTNPDYSVRPDGARHQWREVPPR